MLDSLRILANPKNIQTQLSKADRDTFYWSKEWHSKRDEILIRDNYECQVCKGAGRVATKLMTTLMVHHIQPLEYHPDLKLDDDNLLTVCHQCHNTIHYTTQPRWDDEWWGD